MFKDTYSHMLGCLNVAPGAVARIRASAEASRSDNGAHVVVLCDAILDGDRYVKCPECGTECGNVQAALVGGSEDYQG